MTNSLALPAGIFVPGRLYQVTVDAEDGNGLPDTNSRARRNVQLFVDGPEILLSSTGGAGNGQTLTVNANILNTGGPTTVDVRAWVGVPTGQVVTLFTVPGIPLPHATPTAPAGVSTLFNGPIFSHTFGTAEPPGRYVIGITFSDPEVGQIVATQTLSFNR